MPGDLASHHSIHNTNEPYQAMGDDPDETELDEENINWWAFFLRVLAIILLLMIVILVGVGAISERFWVLAGVLSGGLILVIALSYYRFKCCYRRAVEQYDRHGRVDGVQRQQQEQQRRNPTENPINKAIYE